ncbi:leucyl/phenylalanyl-tRNA--protein transferase [Chrysiogenes arsenatis]|uniref:leucyl/phenylalanyl-tRNA--protein transferase n=1 Tax=Chrysiogenes arsenatis TaxID=309797 RepID=UPI00040AB9B2|nr:leucyl/phenylalanyl-tRNA--protein transferase [Chrysiogenes arsenatis]
MILVHQQPPIYLLAKDSLSFPDPRHAGDMAPLCVGGDLGASRLLEAYRHGIFPWFIEDGLVHWYSPNPRGVVWLTGYRPPRSVLKLLRRSAWEISFDRNFDAAILQCALVKREHEHGTWIAPEFRAAYGWLHRLGYAHSVEVYENGVCLGGLYGVAIGKCFFGESMFSLQPNASKVAFAALASLVQRWGFSCIDCQVLTPHLQMLGAEAVERDTFLDHVATSVTGPMQRGRWDLTLTAPDVAAYFSLPSPR